MFFTYEMGKIRTGFLVRDLIWDFMKYARKNNLSKDELYSEYWVADDYSCVFLEKEKNPLLEFEMSPLENIRDELNKIINKATKILATQYRSKDFTDMYNQLICLRQKVIESLPPEKEDD